MNHKYSWIRPEERLLAQIFGEGRHLRIDSERLNRKARRNRRENARRLLTINPPYPSPIWSWTDGSTIAP